MSTPPYALLAIVAASVAALTLVAATGRSLGSPRMSPAGLNDAVERAAAVASPAVVLIEHQGARVGRGRRRRGHFVTNYPMLYGTGAPRTPPRWPGPIARTTSPFTDALARLRPGQQVDMSVVTTGGRRHVSLTLGELSVGH